MATDDKIEIEIALKNAKKAISDLEKIQKTGTDAAKETEKEFEKSSKGIVDSINKSFVGFAAKLNVAMAVVQAALGSVKKGFDVAKEAARFNQSVDAMQKQFGVNANEMLSALQKVSGGTISNAQLIEAANRSMALNVTKDVGQMAKLLEVARVRARAMGIDTTQAFNDIVTGIGRQSPLILDNLGIITKGWAEEAAAAGVAYDQQFFLNKVLEDGNKILEKTGPLLNTPADNAQRASAAFENLKITLGQKLIPILGLAAESMEAVTMALKGNEEQANRTREANEKLASQLNGVGQKILANYGDQAAVDQQRIDAINVEIEAIKKQKKEIQAMGKEITVWENGKQKIVKVSDIVLKFDKEIAKKEKEISDIQTAPARKKAAEDKAKLNEDEKKYLDDLIKAQEDARANEIKIINALLDKKDISEAEKDAAFERLQVIYKEIEAEKEKNKVVVKTEKAREDGLEVSQAFTETLRGQSAEGRALADSMQEVGKAALESKQNIGGAAKSSSDWVTLIVKLVSTFGDFLATSKNKAANLFGQFIQSTQDFKVAIKSIFPGINGLIGLIKDPKSKKSWLEFLVPVIGPTINKLVDRSKNAAKEINKAWADTYDQIAAQAQRAAFEQERAAADTTYKTELEATASYQKLKELDEADRQDRLAELQSDLSTETDAKKKEQIQRNIDRMIAEEELKKEELRLQNEKDATLADIKKREFEFEKAFQLAQLEAQYANAKMSAADIYPKSRREEALKEIKTLYNDSVALLNSIPVPAYAQGGSFITNGPEMIKVGDNSGGRERVTVEPLNGGSQSKGSAITLNNVTIQANDPQAFFNALNDYQRRYGVI